MINPIVRVPFFLISAEKNFSDKEKGILRQSYIAH